MSKQHGTAAKWLIAAGMVSVIVCTWGVDLELWQLGIRALAMLCLWAAGLLIKWTDEEK